MSATPSPHGNALLRISIMMFLQFFAWGAWFATLGLALDSNGLTAIKGGAYESAPIAAIFAPLFLGLIADRLFSSEKVMAVLMLLGGAIMCGVAVLSKGGAENGGLIVWLMIAYMLCYMPTLGLGNTITFTHLPQEVFPKARVWGTIGWISAGLLISYLAWDSESGLAEGLLKNTWIMAGVVSLCLGIYSF